MNLLKTSFKVRCWAARLHEKTSLSCINLLLSVYHPFSAIQNALGINIYSFFLFEQFI